MTQRVGFIGLGIMGLPMARNLMKAGYAVAVYDISRAKMEVIEGEGAQGAANPADVARRSDLVFSCLPDADVVEKVVTAPGGILEGCREGQVFVDMSTNFPPVSIRLAGRLRDKGVAMLDAPVSGGDKGAAEATLSIMVGGPADAFERCRPMFEAMGKRITHMGEEVGAGGYAKLVNQIMVSVHFASMCEAFVFAAKAGLDLNKLVPALEGGWANSAVLGVKTPKVLQRDFSPTGTVRVMFKDLSYIVESMDAMGIDMPFSRQIRAMYEQLIGEGKDNIDQIALIQVFEKMAGVEVHG